VPKVDGLKRDDGWVDMQVQFLIDKKSAAPITSSAGRCEARRAPREPPPSQLRRVLHRAQGQGHIYTDEGQKPSIEGDVIYSPRGCWHGFKQHLRSGRGAGMGLDGCGLDRGFRLRSRSGESQVNAIPHPEERSEHPRGPRLEGWRRALSLRPSFETPALRRAPQDEG